MLYDSRSHHDFSVFLSWTMHSRQACCSTNSHTIYKCYMIPGRITTSASPPAGQCTAGMHAAYPPSPVLSRTLHTHQRLYSVCTMHTHQRLHSPTPALSMHDAYTPAPVLTDACTQYAMHTHQRLYSPTPALSMHDAYTPTPALTNACTHQHQHSVCTMHTHQRLYSPTPAFSIHDAYSPTPVLTNASTQYARCIHTTACTHQRQHSVCTMHTQQRLYSPTPVLTNACMHEHTHQRLYSPTPALSMQNAYSPTPVPALDMLQVVRSAKQNIQRKIQTAPHLQHLLQLDHTQTAGALPQHRLHHHFMSLEVRLHTLAHSPRRSSSLSSIP